MMTAAKTTMVQERGRHDERRDRVFQCQVPQAHDEHILAQAEGPVRERLGTRVGQGPRAGLGEVTARGNRAAEERDETLDRRGRVAKRGDGNERSADRADERVDHVPTESKYGILSAKNSTKYMTIAAPITTSLLNA